VDVLVVLTDQQRFDTIGDPAVYTPNLDALAADSLRFGTAFCTSPLCVPARHSLLTGLYPHQHLGRGNRVSLPPGLPTFPRLLAAAGYDTAAVGKMHLTPTYADVGFRRMTLAEQDGDGRYADDYHRELAAAGLLDGLDLVDQRTEYRRRAPEAYWRSFGALASDLPEEWHSTTWIADRAMAELSTWDGGGHLLMVGFVKPHHPFDPPPRWLDRYPPEAVPLPPGWLSTMPQLDREFGPRYLPDGELTEDTLRRVAAHYYASISHLDHHVGRLVRLLRERGRYDRTMVVFTSDHGEFLGFHHLLLKHNHPYDPVVRVPLLVKPPAGTASGDRDDLVSGVDLAPTILAACGIEPPDHWPGADLLAGPTGRAVVAAETEEGYYLARSHRYKLIMAPPGRPNLLFDLAADPAELTDRYADPACAAVRDDLLAALHRWMYHDTPAPPYRDPAVPVLADRSGQAAAMRTRTAELFARWRQSR
jgi:arylsulfatase A-like enzyme